MIRAGDNIPLFGWLILRGKCRHCGGAISARYPCVELATGLLFGGGYLAAFTRTQHDLWERVGAGGVLIGLLASWAALCAVMVGALVRFDRRRESRSLARRSGIGRQEDAQAGCELAGLREPVVVQVPDFVGAACISEPVARDAAKRLVPLDHVDDRRRTRS
jgi:Bacterial Peptidase A24 N-terminal domain